jgi:hypothetical protein
MRIRDPKTTALIFASGKMVVTGAKSEDDSRLASRKYARIIQKLGFDAKFAEFKIQNIVGSCDVKFPIRLEGLAFSHGAFSSYEPEVSATSETHMMWLAVWPRRQRGLHLVAFHRGRIHLSADAAPQTALPSHSTRSLLRKGCIYRRHHPQNEHLLLASRSIQLIDPIETRADLSSSLDSSTE